jgi:hypothetical protein
MKNKYVTYLPIVAILLIDGFFFTLTDPNASSTSTLIAGCVLVALTFYTLISKIFGFINFSNMGLAKRNRFLAAYTTVVVVGIIALQSIGDLSLRDILIYVPLAILLYLYLSYGKGKNYLKDKNEKKSLDIK